VKLDDSRVINAVAIQAAEALTFLHQKSVAHTDINPSNMMIHGESMHIVIVDFNDAERFDQQGWQPRRRTYTTYPYRAPELWLGKHVRLPRGLIAADIWSYGVTCVETIKGGASLFGSSGSESTTERIILSFAKGTGALEKLVLSLPKSVGSLSNIHEITRCALHWRPSERSFGSALARIGGDMGVRKP